MAGATFVIGLGFGLAAAPTIVAVQSVVDWQRRGVVTGTNLFCRNLGSAVGVAVFGAIANHTLSNGLAHPPADVAGKLPSTAEAERLVLDGNALSGPVEAFVRSALFDASHAVFLGVLASTVFLIGVLWLMPRKTEPLQFDPVSPPG